MLNYNHNSNPIAALGYAFTTIKMIEANPNTVWDRMATNNFLWNRIWLIIVQSKENNDELDYHAMETILDTISLESIESMMYTYDIILINSNEEQCRLNLLNRGINESNASDVERSNWKNYIKIQNYAYLWLARKFNLMLIDTANFPNLTLLQRAIAKVCKYIIDKIPENKRESLFEPLEKLKKFNQSDSLILNSITDPLIFEANMNMHKTYLNEAVILSKHNINVTSEDVEKSLAKKINEY